MRRSFTTFLFAMLLLCSSMTGRAQSPQEGRKGQLPAAACPAIVTLKGAVPQPARYELRRPVRLMELIAFGGGVTERAGQTIRIEHAASSCDRPAPDASSAQPAEVYNLIDVMRSDEKFNPYLQGGDVVTVPSAEPVYVMGNVVAPQAVLNHGALTLMGALAMAGGTLPNSRIEKVAIYRQKEGQRREVIYANLNAIKKHRAQDVPLQPYDIIEVSLKKWSGTIGRIPIPISSFVKPPEPELPLRVIR